MSPEQARGKTVDKRTDVWAFGCVFFEILTGVRAFGGDDVTDTLAAIVRGVPDWNVLPAETPEAVRRLLRRCLQKVNAVASARGGCARLPDEEKPLPCPPAGAMRTASGEVERHAS